MTVVAAHATAAVPSASSATFHGVKRDLTILDWCVLAAGGGLSGVPVGARVAGFVVAWAQATRDLGRPITLELGFLEYWGKGYPRGTAYRHLREFRRLFPDQTDPQVMAAQLVAASSARGTDPSLLTPVAA